MFFALVVIGSCALAFFILIKNKSMSKPKKWIVGAVLVAIVIGVIFRVLSTSPDETVYEPILTISPNPSSSKKRTRVGFAEGKPEVQVYSLSHGKKMKETPRFPKIKGEPSYATSWRLRDVEDQRLEDYYVPKRDPYDLLRSRSGRKFVRELLSEIQKAKDPNILQSLDRIASAPRENFSALEYIKSINK
jgi:hypothetical protein